MRGSRMDPDVLVDMSLLVQSNCALTARGGCKLLNVRWNCAGDGLIPNIAREMTYDFDHEADSYQRIPTGAVAAGLLGTHEKRELIHRSSNEPGKKYRAGPSG